MSASIGQEGHPPIPYWLLHTRTWRLFRYALGIDLIVYLLSVMWFAAVPLFPTTDGSPNEFSLSEGFIVVTGGLPLLWMASRMSGIGVPGDRWGYAVTATYGLFTMLAFGAVTIFTDELAVTWSMIVTVELWLLSGVVGAFLAHWVDGGKRSIRDALGEGDDEDG